MKFVLLPIFFVMNAWAAEPAQEVSLPKEASEALKKWNGKFEPFKRAEYPPFIQKYIPSRSPALVSADFNGDQISDFAVFGSLGPKDQAIVAILSDKKNSKKWTTVVVQEFAIDDIKNSDVPADDKTEKGIPSYLEIGQGEAADRYKRIHKKDLIQSEAYGGSIDLYAIEGSKALRVRGK